MRGQGLLAALVDLAMRLDLSISTRQHFIETSVLALPGGIRAARLRSEKADVLIPWSHRSGCARRNRSIAEPKHNPATGFRPSSNISWGYWSIYDEAASMAG